MVGVVFCVVGVVLVFFVVGVVFCVVGVVLVFCGRCGILCGRRGTCILWKVWYSVW